MPSPQYGLEGPTSTGMTWKNVNAAISIHATARATRAADRCLNATQGGGDEDGDEACEVLRLGERLEHAGRRVDAQVVEDREVEDRSASRAPVRPSSSPAGRPAGLFWVARCELAWAEHNLVIETCQVGYHACVPSSHRPRGRPCSTLRCA